MKDDRGTLRAISWREICPWLILFRTVTLALTLPMLLLASAAVMLQPLGWHLAEVFISDDVRDADPSFAAVSEFLRSWPSGNRIYSVDVELPSRPAVGLGHGDPNQGDAQGVFYRLSLPFRQLFRIDLNFTKFTYFLFGGLWTLLLWAFVGGVITRMAVVYLGREERISFKNAALYVGKRFGSYFTAPLFPLLGVALLAIPMALLGLVMLLDLGAIVAGLLWIFVLLATLAMAFVLIGLLLGWPLMWPTISAENGDAFEAMSRTYGYTFQRPWHYLFFAIVSALIGALAWMLIGAFAQLIVHLAWWGVSWGTGHERLAEIQAATVAATQDTGTLLYGAAGLIAFFNGLVYCCAYGFGYSLFFCLSSGVYLLLRQVDDETEFDEVYVEEDDERFTLPKLQPDSAGVPTPEGVEQPTSEEE